MEASGNSDKGGSSGNDPDANIELGRSLVRALNNTGISVLYQDSNLNVLWARNVPPSWAAKDLAGLTDTDFLPRSEAQRTIAAKKVALAEGAPTSLEIRIAQQDGQRWFKVWIDADRQNGEMRGVITTAIDITEERRREQALRALLREVSHRSRNMLAIIQSIAAQTGRYSGSIDAFLSRFRGRLQSLASSQDLVTSSNWRGAELRDLIGGQMARYAHDLARSVKVEGINPFLNPNAALHIGLALHELAVNSSTFGALSRPGGQVRISASLAPDPATSGTRLLEFRWSEPFAGNETADKQELSDRRFGSVALEKVVPLSLNGTAALTVEDGQLNYRLAVPAASFEID
ncbi:MAG: sensor histidine kinase [Rhizobiaceae bacterium]